MMNVTKFSFSSILVLGWQQGYLLPIISGVVDDIFWERLRQSSLT